MKLCHGLVFRLVINDSPYYYIMNHTSLKPTVGKLEDESHTLYHCEPYVGGVWVVG